MRGWTAAIVVAALGCGAPDDRACRAADDTDATFCVALLTPGPISDQSWNGGAYAGLLRIRDSLGARISHIQTRTPADFEENFREYGARGYDLVFGHGFEFQDAAARVAPQFPRTVFITTSGSSSGPNVGGLVFRFPEASYMAGVLAGGMTTSGVIGTIGGTELPPVKDSFEAFEQGVRVTRPDAHVLSAYVGNWEDVSAGKELALAQISRGADVIFQNADAAGLGVFQAARERRGVYVIGSNADQSHVAPEIVVGSVVIDLPLAFLTVAREVKSGSFEGRVVVFGARSNVGRLAVNPALRDRVPAPLLARLDSIDSRIHAGELAPAVR